MKTVAAALSGLVLALTLGACGGGGGDPESEVRSELKELGLSKSVSDCVVKQLEKKAGSLEKYADLEDSEQQDAAAKAGAKCASNMSKDEIGDLSKGLEDQDIAISDPSFRKSFITGMTSQGLPEALATCILDKAVGEDLKTTDLVDQATVQRLAASCQ